MKNLIFRITILVIMVISSTHGQNKISLTRCEDDFSFVKKDSAKKGFNQLKYISIAKNNSISFGGELREQFQILI